MHSNTLFHPCIQNVVLIYTIFNQGHAIVNDNIIYEFQGNGRKFTAVPAANPVVDRYQHF